MACKALARDQLTFCLPFFTDREESGSDVLTEDYSIFLSQGERNLFESFSDQKFVN